MSASVKLAAIYFAIASVAGYENAYDLLEWRRPKQVYETFQDDRRRFFTENQNPYLDHTSINGHFNKFGSGYDNIGNGIPGRHFQHFRPTPTDGWTFHHRPSQERIYSSVGFGNYPQHNFRPIYLGFHPTRHYYNQRFDSSLNNIHENKFGLRENTDYTKTNRFLEDNEKENQKKTDEIYTSSQEGVNVGSVRKEKSGEKLHTDQTGENKTSLRSNKVVKKGHTTRGFASHHHKDETGNSTTFFDESSDYGGQSDIRDLADEFGTRSTLEQITHKGDEKFFKESGGQEGSYGSGLLIGNEKFEKDYSFADGQNEFGGQFQARKGEDDSGLYKTYRYLNGDRFDYKQPVVGNYY